MMPSSRLPIHWRHRMSSYLIFLDFWDWKQLATTNLPSPTRHAEFINFGGCFFVMVTNPMVAPDILWRSLYSLFRQLISPGGQSLSHTSGLDIAGYPTCKFIPTPFNKCFDYGRWCLLQGNQSEIGTQMFVSYLGIDSGLDTAGYPNCSVTNTFFSECFNDGQGSFAK